MKIVNVERLNEKFGGDGEGEDIGYRDMGYKFIEVDCEDLDDFHTNAGIGQCWTDTAGVTYYKVMDESDEAVSFTINESGEIEAL